MVRLFRNGLRPSIHAQAKQKDCQKDIWDQAIKKAIMTKANTALNLLLWVHEMDARCPQGHRFASKPTKDHTRDRGSLLFRLQEVRTMLSHCSKRDETSKRPRRDYQKGRHNRNCRNCGLCGSSPQGFTPATGVSMTDTPA